MQMKTIKRFFAELNLVVIGAVVLGTIVPPLYAWFNAWARPY
jgi:hypothetical protein